MPIEALVGGRVIVLASHIGVLGKELQLGLFLRCGFEEGLALLGDVGHWEVEVSIACDEGVFEQKAILQKLPDGRVDLLGQVTQ